ncbi:hypothetical protein Micbo1qcDRAFT_214991 [Microdochium bolleyi]|uniref:Uncharacterized protein n=1 Tax=Microdochium bolleyi TaxID=196109 RepID=A0A136ITI3_9PEZI|nr:hypothetical protein Micbo1qcDRAFT_214991 [Microdochium bolleyi]
MTYSLMEALMTRASEAEASRNAHLRALHSISRLAQEVHAGRRRSHWTMVSVSAGASRGKLLGEGMIPSVCERNISRMLGAGARERHLGPKADRDDRSWRNEAELDGAEHRSGSRSTMHVSEQVRPGCCRTRKRMPVLGSCPTGSWEECRRVLSLGRGRAACCTAEECVRRGEDACDVARQSTSGTTAGGAEGSTVIGLIPKPALSASDRIRRLHLRRYPPEPPPALVEGTLRHDQPC